MAPRKPRSTTARRMAPPPRRAPRSRPRRAQSGQPVGPGNAIRSLLVWGVKTLIAMTPVSNVLSKIADVTFAAFGISDAITHDSSGRYTADVAVRGMSACVGLSYANIIAHAPITVLQQNPGAHLKFDTSYANARLHYIMIKITADTKLGTTNGTWAAAFLPLRDANDESVIRRTYKPMTISEVERLPGSKTGPVKRSLTLTFRPRSSDGIAFWYNNIAALFGFLVISFSQDMRSEYSEFKPDEFAPEIIVKGRVSMREPILGGGANSYIDTTAQLLTGTRVDILTNPPKQFTFAVNQECKKRGTLCTITGLEYSPPKDTGSVKLEDGFESLQLAS